MIYIDTNVFVYAIENHPKYGAACRRILLDLRDGKVDGACSTLILAELLNVLVKLRKMSGEELNVKESLQAVLSLPITWFDMDILVLEKASEYKFNVSGIDYIHLATMEINFIRKVLSADSEFDKIDIVERIDPLEYR